MQDYCKSNQPISLKLGVMIRPTNRKNRLTSGGDPVQDTNSGSFFHFSHHCKIRDFMRFISISHTVTGQFSRHCELTDADKVINPQRFDLNPAVKISNVGEDPKYF